jgi:CubicO group peptidase (beta-lactamase class C family)
MTQATTDASIVDQRRLRGILEELAREYRTPGAQLALCSGDETISVQFGHKRHGGADPVERDSKFPVGSVSKAFTATLVMLLVSDGDIGLDVPVVEYLPELRGADHFAEVTARQLLSHTAGLAADHEIPDRQSASLRRYAVSCRDLEAVSAAGEMFSYSNTGYALLGHLVETITRLDWWTAMESFLLRPLGVEPAFICDPRPVARSRRVVSIHTVKLATDTVQPVSVLIPTTLAPAGALACSADDLIKLARMHFADRPVLLGRSELAEMRTAIPGIEAFGLATGWALGWGMFETETGTWLGHDGTTDGATGHVRFDPAGRRAVALTTNATTGLSVWADLVRELRPLGWDVGTYTPPRSDLRDLVDGAECVGVYRNDETRWKVTSRAGGGLLLEDNTSIQADLALYDDLSFMMRRLDYDDAPRAGRFLRDPVTGSVDLLQVSGRISRRMGTTGR